MPKRYSSKEVLKVLQKKGFFIISQRGSHLKLRNPQGITTVVKANQKIILQGTFSDILRQTNISREEFESLI